MRSGFGCLVEGARVGPGAVDVEGLFVYLLRIDSGAEDQRRVHPATAARRQYRPREVEQPVKQHHQAVLIPIAVASLGGVEQGVRVPGRGGGPSDDATEHPTGRVRSQTDCEMAYQVPLIAGLVERIHPVEANQKVIDKAADG